MAALASQPLEEGIEDVSAVPKPKPSAFRLERNDSKDEHRASRNESEGQEKAGLKNVNGDVRVLNSASPGEPRGHSDSEGSGSGTALLRERPGRGEGGEAASSHVESLRLSSRVDFTLTDTFRVGGKTCTVTLEEDRIVWSPKKSSAKECLFLSDIFAVIPGPITVPPSSRGPRRLSTSTETCNEFTVHALKSICNSPGVLMRLAFKSTKYTTTRDACQVWTQQIKHQLQNFGNRPRRLYVVVNPASGSTSGSTLKTWNRVEALFHLTHITTEAIFTQRKFYARDVLQNLDLSQYDGVVVVGGDGTVNEVLNALTLQAQHQSGVNIRRSRFAPVSVNQRLGVVPTGQTNSVARSILGCEDPMVAAAQIMLGCNIPMDVSSVSHNGQLVMFSAGMMAYGFWSDMSLCSQDFSWLGTHRYGAAILRTLLSHRSFEAEVLYVPVEDPNVVMARRERCFSRCGKCADFDSGLDSPTATSEKGASVLATYSEEDTIDKKHWRKIVGTFSNIMVCPHACSTNYAPRGFSPYGHVGNGCTDLVLLNDCSKIGHARWLMRQKKSRDMFDLPYIQNLRVKEFKFREVLRRSRSWSEPRHVEQSLENLVQDDDDEATNKRAGTRRSSHERGEARPAEDVGGGGGGSGLVVPSSRWNIDGAEIGHSDIEVRVHRHLITMLARGVESSQPGPAHEEEGNENDPIVTAGD